MTSADVRSSGHRYDTSHFKSEAVAYWKRRYGLRSGSLIHRSTVLDATPSRWATSSSVRPKSTNAPRSRSFATSNLRLVGTTWYDFTLAKNDPSRTSAESIVVRVDASL